MAETETHRQVRVRLETDKTASFCMQQNYIDLVKKLTIENGTQEIIPDIVVRIFSEPGFVVPWEGHVAMVGPGQQYTVDQTDVNLSPDFLVQLTERIRGLLHISVSNPSGELTSSTEPVDVLAYDQWPGIRSLPELIAAFILPNHPTVERLLSNASEILRASGKNNALDGYQRETRTAAFEITSAIYEALRRQEIGYINPPANFEEIGQKIRTPERILGNKLGTCIDLTVLFAACLEQAGLHPMVFVCRNHAFAGVWLEEKTFVTATLEDPVEVRKRIDSGEILAVETTLLTTGSALTIDKAIDQGRRHLDDTEHLRCAIDIKRARKAQIRPIHGRFSAAGTFEPLVLETPKRNVEAEIGPMPPVPSIREAPTAEEASSVGETRLDRWRRKLLDLTLNNRLLNFRPTQKTVPLMCADLASFEDRLADGNRFRLLPRPQELGSNDIRDKGSYRRKTGDDGVEQVLKEAASSNRIHTDLDEYTLDVRLTGIFREARLAVEESGTSALYCSLGFLVWYRKDESEKARFAPLILLPVNIVRKSIQHGFALELGDDEPRVNVSLLEMLAQDFNLYIHGLDPLPRDDHGIDIPKVFDIFRRAVQDIKKWEVREIAHLGFFSFNKFLMWRDLQEHTEDLLENAVVNHLVNYRNREFDPGTPIPKPERLDYERSPKVTFCPVSADSSQLRAVFAAADGQSFVLEGPPGTGKSQTITNIIAQCLANKKTVLFVAEKNVALKVVYDRLEAIGLGDFCLELHSNKARKSDVMQQLSRAMSRQVERAPETWDRETDKVSSLRDHLNAYVAHLHEKRETGESVFDGLSRLIAYRDTPDIRISWPNARDVTAERLAELHEIVRSLCTIGAGVGTLVNNPWRSVQKCDWTPLWQREIEERLETAIRAYNQYIAIVPGVASILGFPKSKWTNSQLHAMASATSCLLDPPTVSKSLVIDGNWSALRNGVLELITHGRARDELRSRVFALFKETILSLDISTLLGRLKASASKRGLIRWFHRLFVWWKLRPALAPGMKVSLNDLEPVLENAEALRSEEEATRIRGDLWSPSLEHLWKGGQPDWPVLERAVEWAGNARSIAFLAGGDNPEEAIPYRKRWADMVTETPETLTGDGAHAARLREFRDDQKELERTLTDLAQSLQANNLVSIPEDDSSDALGKMRVTLESMSKSLPGLKGWCQWKSVRERAVEAGLEPLVSAYESGTIRNDQLEPTFEKGFYRWWTDTVVSSEPILYGFNSQEHLRKINEFCEADNVHQEHALQMVRHRLSTRLPTDIDNVSKNSAMGILKRETQKRKRHVPVRALLGEAGDVVTRLTPCFLMSPISVAQFLDPKMPKFDVVIFDEASQIPVWDAVGTIARGRSTIVVGDPKQLPPTTFFNRSDDDEAEAGDQLEDLESILDDCIGAGLPWLRLRWHYRSRHESLITFSNFHYYDNKLFTFPSTDTSQTTETGVSFRNVANAIYDIGKTRTNRKEAEALVTELIDRLRRPEFTDTIGIVTLNVQQRTLIEDLVDQARLQFPEIESALSEEADEPVFIKNLENVQGDERDIIMFSIGYGPDIRGKVGMNFGPMNRDGGHRRLNVAITRARREVIVFSSLRADQIDLARTKAQGVKDLKAYLDYAERGFRAISEIAEHNPEADFDSPFEEEVYFRLTSLGWTVHKQVGCSGYRIDLAVVDNERPGRYLMGIECDGASYHSAATARDRDKLRASVLSGLGWNLHRIWSTDWWQDPETEIKRLHSILQETQAKAAEDDVEEETPLVDVALKSVPAPKPTPNEPSCVESLQNPISYGEGLPYKAASIESGYGDTTSFYELADSARIRAAIVEIVEMEGPISLHLLSRRIGARWSLGRVTNRAQKRISQLIDRASIMVIRDGGTFFWPAGLDPKHYSIYRYPADPAGEREANDIPIQEVANAARYVLRKSISMPNGDLARETARIFGFQRMGTKVSKRMYAGISRLIENEHAIGKDDLVVLAD